MTDSKTPEWVGPRYSVHTVPANNKVLMLERSDGDWVKHAAISQALLSAYERGRKEGIEEAAKVVGAMADECEMEMEPGPLVSWIREKTAAIRQLLEVKG